MSGSFGREPLARGIAYVRPGRRYGGLRKVSVRELDRLFGRMLAGATGGKAPRSGPRILPFVQPTSAQATSRGCMA
jgi:hypothetical protein